MTCPLGRCALLGLALSLCARRGCPSRVTPNCGCRDGTTLIELAYGWRDLKELNRRVAHD